MTGLELLIWTSRLSYSFKLGLVASISLRILSSSGSYPFHVLKNPCRKDGVSSIFLTNIEVFNSW